jgi:hypothetical protein
MVRYAVKIKYQKRAKKVTQRLLIQKPCLIEALPELICQLQHYHREQDCDDIKDLEITRLEKD